MACDWGCLLAPVELLEPAGARLGEAWLEKGQLWCAPEAFILRQWRPDLAKLLFKRPATSAALPDGARRVKHNSSSSSNTVIEAATTA